MNMYRAIGDRIGSTEARDLAQQLVRWHDAMVRHLRVTNHHGRSCPEGCPHEEARTLWMTALEVFGGEAMGLDLLQRHGGASRASSPALHHAEDYNSMSP
jgi:hypothetical protein